jgi:hypothetical protein
MVSDEATQHCVGVLGVAQVPGAVEGVQARQGEARRVADVVQPRGGFQEICVGAENWRQAACLSGDALDMRPAAGRGTLRSARARRSADEARAFMWPKLGNQGGMFTDVAGCLETSC